MGKQLPELKHLHSLPQSSLATKTKYFRVVSLQNRNLFLIILEAENFIVKVTADSVPGEDMVSGSQMVPSRCASHGGRGGTFSGDSGLNHLPKALLPSIKTLGVKILTYRFGVYKHSDHSGHFSSF